MRLRARPTEASHAVIDIDGLDEAIANLSEAIRAKPNLHSVNLRIRLGGVS